MQFTPNIICTWYNSNFNCALYNWYWVLST